MPDDIESQVRAMLAKDRTLRWDAAVAEIAKTSMSEPRKR